MNPSRVTSSVSTSNPLNELADYGQSVWLDYIRRSFIQSGELKRLVEEDGLRGITSNPAIFEKAIGGSTDYAAQLDSLGGSKLDAKGVFEELAVQDIQAGCDILKPVYTASNGRDGYVSLEVSPALSHDTQATMEEARRLWKRVDRSNLMVKVPATPEGIPAIRQLIGEGININVTLLFAQSAYEKVAEAYISGLEKLAAGGGGDLSRVASVASFFISRIDSEVDARLHAKLKQASSQSEKDLLQSLLGKVAIANARLTYQRYKQIFSGPRWEALKGKGAHTQRLLWASTSTKDPSYRDVLYVEELIGPDTVNTMPPATFDAFRDHGKPRPSLEEDPASAQTVMDNLKKAGISMTEVTDKLLDDGVKLFEDAFTKLMTAIQKNRSQASQSNTGPLNYKLAGDLEARVNANLEDWAKNNKVRRLWDRDASLWTNTDESKWLGWLGIVDHLLAAIAPFTSIAEEVKQAGFTHAALLGMGGSSLCPEVMAMTFGKIDGSPELHVLDSTDPAQVKAFEQKLDLKKTIFIVSSKSGSTLEPNIFKQYFFELMKNTVGAEKAPQHFIAITDPGSAFEKVATSDKFRHIYHGVSSIGGRYSALSNFGMVPAAIMGVDVKKFLDRTEEMAHACVPDVPAKENPGLLLGVILGTHAVNGKDKITLITSPRVRDLGAWLEQLLAESTGKEGKGVIPVDREELGAPQVYGDDRLFVYIHLKNDVDEKQEAALQALEKAGKSVVRIEVLDIYDLGQEFFRWEIATAVAGAIMGINPFNQPDVEASKVETRALTTKYEETGSLPAETPILDDQGIKLFADQKYGGRLVTAASNDKSLTGYLKAHLNTLRTGDYCALLAYLPMNDANEQALQKSRLAIRDKKKSATCLGFGPRFLHSTGQAYKGGPNTGVFFQITCDDAQDLKVPGQKFTFGVVKAAQARGDFQVLSARDRRALRIHLGADLRKGLQTLYEAIIKAIA